MTKEIGCSFCSLKQDKVEKLMQSHCGDVYICNTCIDVCYDVTHPRDFPSRNEDNVQIDIFEETVYRVIVQGQVDHDMSTEMYKWVKENLSSYISMNVDKRSFEFIFQNEGDAIAFKLRWL
ncbi:hypothetical protein LCGC14_1051120 [marine sediment metagenome]|uniref:ClpX-type ZB domain-containing protein n=1 Tax=marine sediment metagenome TaxID=412755 RepID=A0A0F9Q6Y6_9ZZZZ